MERVSVGKKSSGVADFFNFDPDNVLVPNHAQAYYKFVDYFFAYTIAGEAITKKAEFIVSGLKISSTSPEGEDYGEKLVRKLDIKNKFTRLAVSYFAYGLAALYPMPKIRKILECKKCKFRYPLDKLEKNYKPLYTYGNGKYQYKCTNKECANRGQIQDFKLHEEEIDDISEYSLAVWSPHQLTCIYNSVADKKLWMYECDNEMRKLLSERDHFTICSTPESFITSIEKGNKVRIDSDRLYILEYPNLTIKGIPIPPMVCAFQDLYQRQMYQKANRKIAEDILVPLRMLFPVWKGESGARPILNTQNMETWAKETRSEINKWRDDKSHVPIMPVEIGTKNIWGEGKLLVLNDNLKANLQDILADIGIPLEFIYGGATWSRQNVSSITLENVLRALSNKLSDPLGFIESKINKMLSKDQQVKIRLDVPRLVDPMTEVSMLYQMEANRKYSTRSFLGDLGKDYDEEMKRIRKEDADADERAERMATAQAKGILAAEKLNMGNEDERRSVQRREMLKDSLANRAIEKDQMMFNILMQEYQYKKQLEMQTKMLREQAKQEKKMMPLSLEAMRQQIGINEESQARMAKYMQKLQTLGIKQQIKAQHNAQRELEEAEQKRQEMQMQREAIEMMNDDEREALGLLPEPYKSQMIQSFIQRAKTRQTYESMPEDIKAQMQDMTEEERMQAISEFDAQQQEEDQLQQAAESDEALHREMMKKKMNESMSQADMQQMAMMYNKMSPEDKQNYRAELMQEDATIYAKVKGMADDMAISEYIVSLLNSDDKSSRDIWNVIASNHPELLDDVMKEYNAQMTYKQQALGYAVKLLESYGSPDHEELLKGIKSTPIEFRQMIMGEYQKLIGGSDDDPMASPEFVSQMANEIKNMDPEARIMTMEAMKSDAPLLYSKVTMQLSESEEENNG